MKKQQRAFTIVELIIVISILAVLGTIAFMTYQSYARDARNTKRVADIQALDKMFSVEVEKGVSPLSFVGDSSSMLSGTYTSPDYRGPSIAGFIGSSNVSGRYNAGNINYTTFGIKPDLFSDPRTLRSYKIGVAVIGGTKYQFAATLEKDTSIPYIIGNYTPRRYDNSLKTANGGEDSVNKYIYRLSDPNDAGKFVAGDKLWPNGGSVIKSVSADGMTLYFDPSIDASGTQIGLTEDESRGLIRKYDDDWPVSLDDPYSQPAQLIPYSF